ncbi:MAG: 50S ribosomal protein L6 [Candidatus Cyclobacteriaceae bacterium M3_2C_046]
MSRIGKNPITLPKDVTIEVSKSNLVTVKGPKGALTQQVDPDISVKMEDGVLKLERPTEHRRHKSLHGLYRSLINNMVVGVSQGYTKELELIGVGYRANAQGQVLELNLGYSHSIFFSLPEEIAVKTEAAKGQTPKVLIEGIDKQLVGQVAAKIKSLRRVEPYKGKGIRYKNEYVRRKAGKTAAK